MTANEHSITTPSTWLCSLRPMLPVAPDHSIFNGLIISTHNRVGIWCDKRARSAAFVEYGLQSDIYQRWSVNAVVVPNAEKWRFTGEYVSTWGPFEEKIGMLSVTVRLLAFLAAFGHPGESIISSGIVCRRLGADSTQRNAMERYIWCLEMMVYPCLPFKIHGWHSGRVYRGPVILRA